MPDSLVQTGRLLGVHWAVVNSVGVECCLAFGFTKTQAKRRCLANHKKHLNVIFGGYPG
jgi:hypothetical protein